MKQYILLLVLMVMGAGMTVHATNVFRSVEQPKTIRNIQT